MVIVSKWKWGWNCECDWGAVGALHSDTEDAIGDDCGYDHGHENNGDNGNFNDNDGMVMVVAGRCRSNFTHIRIVASIWTNHAK